MAGVLNCATASEGQATAVYEEVAAENPDATEEGFIAQLTVRLCNPEQVWIARMKFERAEKQPRESITEWADHLQELVSCLP